MHLTSATSHLPNQIGLSLWKAYRRITGAWISTKGQSWPQITAGGRPWCDGSPMHFLFTHTPAPSRLVQTAAPPKAHSHFVTPQEISPPLSHSPLCMRNRWGGAIKWICCYFPRLLAEDVKPQPLRQPRMTAEQTHSHTACHAQDQLYTCVLFIKYLGHVMNGLRSQKKKSPCLH